jgi:glycosyltransferase involved in cell wall biosynthesis
MLITRRLGHDPRLAAEDALRALVTKDWSVQPGGLLTYFPVVRGNPFQALLYSRVEEVGLTPVPTYDIDTTIDVARAVYNSGLHLVVHVHWLNVVMATAADWTSAREMAEQYVRRIHALKDLDARLIWTVHNILPHEARFPDLEVELRQAVVAASERVHVMSPRTRELVAPWFDIPEEKVLAVPHPAYHGAYPAWMSREHARAELGLAPEVMAFLLLGRIHPYKGLTELIDAFDELCAQDPGRYALLVAGEVTQDEESQYFRERLLLHPAAYAALRKVPEDELQVYLRAADVAVFPYRQSLNSGALALALTYGLPVVLRADAGDAGRVSPSYAARYNGATRGGLLDAMVEAQRLANPAARRAAARAARRVAPARVSRAFGAALRRWVDHEPSRASGDNSG